MGTPEQIRKPPEKYTKDFKEGEIFFFEGERGEEMFIIQVGSVGVYKKVQNLNKEIATLKAGDFFGEMSLILNEPRSATIKALEGTSVIVINKNTFTQMLAENNKISIKMVEALAARVRETDEKLKKIMEDRIFIALLTLIEDSALKGQKSADGRLILTETMEDLARVIGLPIIKIDEFLKIMQKAGFIECMQNSIILRDWKLFMEFKRTYITKFKI
jgi:CRP/FNR family cyclic AMP-dependent transcriptional regulator